MTIATATLLMANPTFGSGVHIEAYQLLIGVQEMAEGIVADDDICGDLTERAILDFLSSHAMTLGLYKPPASLPLLRAVPALGAHAPWCQSWNARGYGDLYCDYCDCQDVDGKALSQKPVDSMEN